MATFLSCVASNVAFAGCLAVFAMALTRVWRSPHLAHALWLLVLIKLVTPPFVHIPVDRLMVASHTASNPRELGADTDQSLLSSISSDGVSFAPPEMNPLSSELDEASRPHPGMRIWHSVVVSWPQWLLAVWAIGTVVSVSVGVRRHLRLLPLLAGSQAPDTELAKDAEQLAQQIGLAACPPLLVTVAHICPFVTPGIRKPTIVLPRQLLAELNRDQVRSILAHELAHIRRRDHWVRIFEVGVLTLNWWNPIAWWASRQLHRAEEECCDTLVVWALPDSRRIYGHTLLKAVEYLTREKGWPDVAGTSFGGCFLERRIEVILNQTMKHRISRPALALILVMSTVVLPVGISRAFSDDESARIANQTGRAGETEKASKVVQESEKTKGAYASGQKEHSGDADEAIDSPLHALVRAAWNSSLTGLNSGKGQAEWKAYVDDRVVRDALVDVTFSGPQYRLAVTFRKPHDGVQQRFDRLTAVNDGSVLLCSRFSPRIRPLGCEIRAYESSGWLNVATEGCDFPPNALPRMMLDVDTELSKCTIAQQDNGILLVTQQTKLDTFHAFADPQFGYNVVRSESVERADPDNSWLRGHATWERQDDVWFIRSIVTEERLPKRKTRVEFRYVTFAPNCPVDERSFTMEALEALEGSRIICSNGDIYSYTIATLPIDGSGTRTSLLEQVKSMKKR